MPTIALLAVLFQGEASFTVKRGWYLGATVDQNEEQNELKNDVRKPFNRP